jgi:xanthine dehydrogenase YagS FAD-binding subunit
MAVAMRALDAKVETILPDGNAEVIPIAELHRLPGSTPQIETILKPGQIITAVTLPPPLKGVQIYRKVRDRASYAFAMVSVAAVVDAVGGKIRSARVALGGIAPKPWRVPAAEDALVGATPGEPAFREAGRQLVAGARGHGDNDFKIGLAQRTVAAVLSAATRAA